ncbi:hypothetical protein CDAR_311751 [Caerostris darwini]|uniref:Uncharacterized protein n=1 Tax=Caerostris darwini TaxID=1538125 RepID=A0AAV4TL39_9ARAC|nr:hypothetical protein CDAR_311751 [Caerostris darwini]
MFYDTHFTKAQVKPCQLQNSNTLLPSVTLSRKGGPEHLLAGNDVLRGINTRGGRRTEPLVIGSDLQRPMLKCALCQKWSPKIDTSFFYK